MDTIIGGSFQVGIYCMFDSLVLNFSEQTWAQYVGRSGKIGQPR